MKDLTKLHEMQGYIQAVRASSIWNELESVHTTTLLLEARGDLLRAYNKLEKVRAILKVNNILSEKEISK